MNNQAQDPTGVSQSATYSDMIPRYLSLGIFALAITLGLLSSRESSASLITGPVDTSTNSQRVDLLAPNYSLEVPQAIGGPNDTQINNQLALFSPQISISDQVIKNPITTEVDENGIMIYTVQSGDTISEIAELFDVSVNTIKWENNTGSAIKPGQELRILPVTGVRHTITKGDTLSKIAEKYDVEIEDITVFNDIDETSLVTGEKILVPNGVKKTVMSKVIPATNSASVSYTSSGSGYYMRPTSGVVTSSFGPRKGSYHYGIDYGAPTGTPIVATAEGTVLKTSCGSGYGNCLVIQHNNGTQSLYAHASVLYVSAGTYVSQGERVAAVGSTGRSTGPHLHFEIIESNGKKRNVNFLK